MLPILQPYKTSQGLDSMRGANTQEGVNQVTYIQREIVDMHSVFGTAH